MKSSPPLSGTARRAALLGLLAALAVALSFLEGLLPVIPIPGAKLGLSNIVIMYALTSLNLPCALALAAVKAAFALLRGGTAFFMSLAGGLLSTLVMAGALAPVPESGQLHRGGDSGGGGPQRGPAGGGHAAAQPRPHRIRPVATAAGDSRRHRNRSDPQYRYARPGAPIPGLIPRQTVKRKGLSCL